MTFARLRQEDDALCASSRYRRYRARVPGLVPLGVAVSTTAGSVGRRRRSRPASCQARGKATYTGRDQEAA